jgi:membrane-associated phospholipid phosphatase
MFVRQAFAVPHNIASGHARQLGARHQFPVFLPGIGQDGPVSTSGPAHRSDRPLAGLLRPVARFPLAIVAGVVAMALVAVYGFLLAGCSNLLAADQGILETLSRNHSSLLVILANAVYKVFSPVGAIIISLVIVAAILLFTRNLRLAVTFGAVVALTWIPSGILKILVDRPRPDATLLLHPFAPMPTDASYPSGHAVFITSLAMAFIFLARGRRFQPLVIVAGILGAILLTVSFPYIGVHYVSDVVASLVWSTGVSFMVLALWNRFVLPLTYRHRRLGRTGQQASGPSEH